MKKSAMLFLFIAFLNGCFLFGQVPKDTLKEDNVYPQFYGYFSAEESWQLHKEAYKKQMEAQGISEKEIKKRMLEYEKQKEEALERIKKQKSLAEKQRQLAEVQRQEAEIQRKEAAVQRQKAAILRQKAQEQRKLADQQRQLAEAQRKLAAVQRQKAFEQRKLAEEWRKSIKKIHRENITFSKNKSEVASIPIEVNKKNTLFFNINGSISSGNMIIEIFNPNGKKEGELSLEHRKKSTSQTGVKYSDNTSGSLNKTINSPEIGDWLVKITAEKAESNVNISVAQYVKTTVNE